MKKALIAVAVLVVIAVFVGINMKKQRGKAIEVKLERVERRDLVETVSASGKIQPQTSVDISADITGKIVSVDVEEGDIVAPGDLLLRIDPTQFREALRSAEAQHQSALAGLNEARANLELQELEWERSRALYKSGTISDRDFQTYRANYKQTEARLISAERNVDQAAAYLEQQRDQLAKTEIRAPIHGVVVRRNADIGEIALASTMSVQVLMAIADLAVMEVEIDVDETEIPKVSIGQAADVEIDAYPDSIFAGKVTEIANSPRTDSSNQGVDFRVVITLDQSHLGLRPGLSATAEVTCATREDVLAIPIQALTMRTRKALEDDAERFGPLLAKAGVEVEPFSFDENQKEIEGVMLSSEGRALFRAVRTGIVGEQHFELLSGLSGDETLIIGPMKTVRTLHHGERIRAQKEDEEEREERGGDVSVTVETDE